MTKHKLQQVFNELGIQTFDMSEEAIQVCCPFCLGATHGRRDDAFKCGVFVETLRYHCLRCKRTGSLFKLLQNIVTIDSATFKRLTGAKLQQADETLSEAIRRRFSDSVKEGKVAKEIKLPMCSPAWDFDATLGDWLWERKISFQACEDYGLLYGGYVGSAAHRLVIPLYNELGDLVAWQGRDITGKKKAKYFTQGYITDHLYWSAYMRKPHRIYLVEGALDAIRLNYNAVACFTHSLSKRQRTLLMQDQMIDELVICWDGDSYDMALKEAHELAPIMNRVGVVRLPDGEDPDSMGSEAVRSLAVRWV